MNICIDTLTEQMLRWREGSRGVEQCIVGVEDKLNDHSTRHL